MREDVARKRLDEIIDMGRGRARFSLDAFRRWLTSTRNLMLNFVGMDTPHYEDFLAVYGQMHLTYPDVTQERDHISQVVGILEAVRDDIATGFMFKRDLLISAANFEGILEQAEHLLSNGYKDAAAVLAGAALESSLRKLCDKRGLACTPKETMEPLNVKLAKDGAYQARTQKMITAWGDLRNNAAHGRYSEYTKKQVADMVGWVREFAARHLA